ncbi:MAG TPA: hypothetical protein VGF28_17935 [Thermoanaerobaculia bacterium]|jgi:hypothetical protein
MKLNGNTLGAGCLILFGLPFAVLGTWSLIGFVRGVRNGALPEQMFMMGVIGLVFCLAGFGLILGALFGRRSSARLDELRARHPGQPWMWNEEWASRRVTDSSVASTRGLWMIALLWNTVSSPILFFGPRELAKGNYVIIVGLIFPVVGLIMLGGAVRATMRVLRFPRSTLFLDHVPIPVGGTLRGRVEVPFEGLADAASIIVRLTATTRVRSGKSTIQSIACQEDREIVRGMVQRAPNGVSIPIVIDVPAEGPQTITDGHAQSRWSLTLDADIPGVDYSAAFDVPVFGTAPAEARAAMPHVPPPEPRAPLDYKAKQTVEGRELYFGRFRARGMAIGVLLLTLAVAVVFLVVLVSDAPFIGVLVFGLFTALLTWSTLELFLGTNTILLGREKIVLRHTLFRTKERVLRRDEIASATAKIGAQSSGRPLYEVEVQTTAGKKVSAARYIRGKREAEWVAAQIRGAIDSRP